MHISNTHLEKDVVILPDLWEVTFFTCMTIFHAKMHLLRNFATRHTDVFVLTFTVYVSLLKKVFFFNNHNKNGICWKKSFTEYQTMSSYVMTTYNATLEGKLFFFLFLLRFHEKLISLIWDDGQTRRMTYMIFMRELVSVPNSTKQLIQYLLTFLK